MPRVRFLTPVATDERAYHEREVADVSGPLASAWVKSGNVEILRGSDADAVEQPPAGATVQTPEGAAQSVETPEQPRKKAPARKRATKKTSAKKS